MQSVEDPAPENDSTVKSLKEAARASASSKQKISFSGNFSSDDFNNPAKNSEDNKLKQAEESLRTVMSPANGMHGILSLSGFPYPELLTNATIFMGSMAPETHLNRLKFSDSCLALAW
ncbi:hypothetical protein DKX38_030023 [Salix brachista]|uniref:Uncharacterized protein n=1 Tax=Salix brachista TaxID=2182728 RepID=A0A5N5J5F6_9ROSI|nr:hypothetical protein DKX38_030023 [Salix brachista]